MARSLTRHHRACAGRRDENEMFIVASQRSQMCQRPGLLRQSGEESESQRAWRADRSRFLPRQSARSGNRCHQFRQTGCDRPDVSGSSISANLVPLVGTFDLGYLFSSFPQQTKAFDAGAAKPIEEALLKGAGIRILSWAYNFGSRSVLAKKPVKGPEDLAGLKIRTLPNPVITECLRLMGAAATPLAF